ncbi:hypothetical protein [Streptomyces clavifer]|uniref:hypothetical protein n=1 Tax=Streptomyces clavifer TaxID=68188 RepID=UPI00339F14F3
MVDVFLRVLVRGQRIRPRAILAARPSVVRHARLGLFRLVQNLLAGCGGRLLVL